MTCTLLQKVFLEKQGSLKAAQGVLPLSSDSVRQSSGLESENELYLTADFFFLVRIIGEQGTRIILCFCIFSQLWLQPLGTDINSYSQFGTVL